MKKLQNILIATVLTAGIVGGCATQTKTTTLARRQGQAICRDEYAIRGLIRTDYVIGSELDIKKQIIVNQEYNKLMKLNDKKRIWKEIGLFADYEFGNIDGLSSLNERTKAHEAFKNVLITIADINGNYNKEIEQWELEKYNQEFGDRPFIQVLRGNYRDDP